jgi:RNA polymerase sigma-70 factor (ECF subfamily)
MIRASDFPDTRPSLIVTLGGDVETASAWREFFDRYAPAIYRVARMRGLAHDDADDIVQQTMVSISSHIGDFRYDRDRGRFRNWVRKITENKIKSMWRKRPAAQANISRLDALPDGAPCVEDLWENEWRIQDLIWCLDQVEKDISPRKMEAFRKYVLEGIPAEEVARQMEMSVGNIYVTRHTVLSKIRRKAAELESQAGDSQSPLDAENPR